MTFPAAVIAIVFSVVHSFKTFSLHRAIHEYLTVGLDRWGVDTSSDMSEVIVRKFASESKRIEMEARRRMLIEELSDVRVRATVNIKADDPDKEMRSKRKAEARSRRDEIERQIKRIDSEFAESETTTWRFQIKDLAAIELWNIVPVKIDSEDATDEPVEVVVGDKEEEPDGPASTVSEYTLRELMAMNVAQLQEIANNKGLGLIGREKKADLAKAILSA